MDPVGPTGPPHPEPLAGASLTVDDPSTGQVLAVLPGPPPGVVGEACREADAARHRWAGASARARSDVLLACSSALLEHVDELAGIIVAENGKPRADAEGEVRYAADFFRWSAELVAHGAGSLARSPSDRHHVLTRRLPVGVVAAITPWNFPAAMVTRKVAPAVGAGNGVVVKPAPQTPLTALRLAELFVDAGLPPGLVAVVPTSDADAWTEEALAEPAVRMVSFTGSTPVGRLLLHRAADRVLRCSMELGGNAPFVVLDDCDVGLAVEAAMQAKMRHSAQTCTAANRFYVQRGVLDEFTDRLGAAMAAVVVGPGSDPSVSCGPLIDARASRRLGDTVASAVAEGAQVVVGGAPLDRPGHFFAPTVLTGVRHEHRIARAELFGPVAPIIAFDEPEQAITWANDTEAGLAAYLMTGDLARGLAMSERIEAGMVGLNVGLISDPAAPFGGMKASGVGREGGAAALEEYSEVQYVATDW